jgi:hypothetical protein
MLMLFVLVLHEGAQGQVLSFAPPQQITQTLTFAFAAADLNHDGNADLIFVSSNIFNHVSIRLGKGNGEFGPGVCLIRSTR